MMFFLFTISFCVWKMAVSTRQGFSQMCHVSFLNVVLSHSRIKLPLKTIYHFLTKSDGALQISFM